MLEAAHFAPVGIRRTARAHQIATDSSYRFERGVDHGANLVRAYQRAATLIAELTGARATAAADVQGDRPAQPVIDLRPARVQLVLGIWVYHEPFSRSRMLSFGFIWAALALYTVDSVLSQRRG